MSDNNLGFVSPYLLRPLRTELEAARDIAKGVTFCPRCGELIPADCEVDGCRDLECPRAK